MKTTKMVAFKSLGKLFLTSVVAFTLTVFVFQCIEMYFEHPTYLDITEVDQTEAPFPAITLCPGQKKSGYNTKVLKVRLSYYSSLN